MWLHEITPELAYQAIECGVRGILSKSLAPEMIVKCVRKVQAGELWFEKALTQTFLSGRTVKVSRREGELITLVTQGLKNKEIATRDGHHRGNRKSLPFPFIREDWSQRSFRAGAHWAAQCAQRHGFRQRTHAYA